MKKRIMQLLITLLLSALVLIGCDAKGNENILDINKITYVRTAGDINTIEMFVITSNFSIKKYVITPYSDSHFDLFAGQLPSEEEYTVNEWQISEENWNHMVDALIENDFMGLPEDIPCSAQVFDASSYYIEIETNDVVHRVGGYDVGQATDSVNKRFKNIINSLEDNI